MILPQNAEQLENSERFVKTNGLHWAIGTREEGAIGWIRRLQKAKGKRALEACFESTRGVVDGKGLNRFCKLLEQQLRSDPRENDGE